MRDAKLLNTGHIDPADVDARKRIRPVSEAGVEAVVASYEQIGVIKDPIDLRKMKSGAPKLIAGGHRLEAARRLGIQVPFKMWDCTADWAQLCEIDDNLAGADLIPLDRALFLARRKAVYEKVHPEAKRGHAGGKARHGQLTASPAVSSFAASSAEAMGVSERTVFNLLRAGAAITPELENLLRTAPGDISKADLEVIAKADDDQRRVICTALADGSVKKASDAAAQFKAKAEAAQKDPVEAAFTALLERFRRAPKEAQRRFVETEREALDALLAETLFDDDGSNVVALNG